MMKWFLCIGFVLVANGCANTATKVDERKKLESKIITPISMEQFLHSADVLFPEFEKSCNNGSPLPSPSLEHYNVREDFAAWDHNQACASYSRIIALSYLASERYKDAIKFIKYYKGYLENIKANGVDVSPTNEFCGYDLFFSQNDGNNRKFKFEAQVNINSALFLAYDKINDPQAKDYVISGYLCGTGHTHQEIEIGNTSVAFPGIDRLNTFKSADYFYKDVNKYLGQSAEQYSRFYISKIVSPIIERGRLIARDDNNKSYEEQYAKNAILRKNAIDFAKNQQMPQPYIDYMVSEYQMYLSLSR